MYNPVDDITTRCETLGITVTSVLRDARVEWSNFSRWRNGETSPTMTVLKRIDAVLTEKESATAKITA